MYQSWKNHRNGSIRSIKRPKDPKRIFVDQVTIAGLREAFGPFPAENYLFRVVLVLALGAILYLSYVTIRKYASFSRAFDTTDITGTQAPFPNVTICGPEAMKKSVMRRLASQFGGMDAVLQQLGLSLEAALEGIISMAAFSVRSRPYSPRVRMGMHAVDSMVGAIQDGYMGYLRMSYPTCSEMFDECTFGTVKFNCCDAAELMLFDARICYHFSVSFLKKNRR